MRLKKVFYTFVALLAIGLGVLGTFLPLLPTTPFLLLATYCLLKGNPRFHRWFITTGLYKRYLAEYMTQGTMTRRSKITILIAASSIMVTGIILTPILWARILLGVLIVIKYYVFLFKIKTAEPKISKIQVLEKAKDL